MFTRSRQSFDRHHPKDTVKWVPPNCVDMNIEQHVKQFITTRVSFCLESSAYTISEQLYQVLGFVGHQQHMRYLLDKAIHEMQVCRK